MHFSLCFFLSSSFLRIRDTKFTLETHSLSALSALCVCVCVKVCVLLKKTLLMSRLANRAFRSLVAGLSSTSSSGSSAMRSVNSSFRKVHHHHRLKRSYGGATPKGSSSYFSQGTQTRRNGLLFGETPPLKGTRRIRESWELPYFATFFSAGVILYVGLNGKPDTSLVGWAKEEARKRLEKEEEEDER